jgi:hypothetical protein
MSQAALLLPPIDAGEIETFAFDFSLDLGNATIVSVVSVTCTVSANSSNPDASPSSRVIGPSQIGASQKTGMPASTVLQQFGNMLANVTYVLQCFAMTSGGDKLSLWADLQCVQPS